MVTTGWDSWYLGADRLIFEPGARLIFSRTALSKRQSVFIGANSIVTNDDDAPGTITWESYTPSPEPDAAGEAASGRDNGSAGVAGNPGNPGQGSAAAPELTLFVAAIPNVGPVIEFAGRNRRIGRQRPKGRARPEEEAADVMQASLLWAAEVEQETVDEAATVDAEELVEPGAAVEWEGPLRWYLFQHRFPRLSQIFRVDVSGG